MGELEDKLNSILTDPAQMEKIAGLAKSLMGGEGAESPPPDAALLGRLGRALGNAGEGREQALLAAMKPYLSEKRRGKLDRALKLAKLARIAGLAMEEADDDQPL